jgi:hypothetical protein
MGVAVGAAIVEAIAPIVIQQLVQRKFDQMNAENFQHDLAAKQPLIDSLIASQRTRISELQARGVPAYVNLSLETVYQTDSETGGTLFIDLDVKDVKISEAPVERVTTTMASHSLASILREQLLGRSKRLVSFSLTYPGLKMASKEANR